MKKVENMPVAMRPRMALEPVRLRNLSIRSGMIGLESLDSRTTKAVKSTMAMPRHPRVSDAPQPRRDAVTMP